MNEKLVKRLMSEISNDPQAAEFLLEMVDRCVTIHKYVKKKVLDFVLLSGPVPTKEGGEAILEALYRKSENAQEKHKLRELQSYWLANYDDIVRVIKIKGPLR